MSKNWARSGDVGAQHLRRERNFAEVLLFALLKETGEWFRIDRDHDCTLQGSPHKKNSDFAKK